MKLVKVKYKKYRTLMKHQQDFISWGLEKTHVPNLMDLRLGKTLSTIRLIKEWTDAETNNNPENSTFPVLIVAPSAVLETWEKELRLEYEQYVILQGKTFDRRSTLAVKEGFGISGRRWILINYESLLYTPGIAFLPWFSVVSDESVIIKNPKSKISQLFTKGFHEVKHRVILTGLISPEGELDIFQQMYFLYREFMGCTNYYEYRAKYFRLQWDGWACKPSAKLQIENAVHATSFALTRTQAGIGNKKVRQVRKVSLTTEQQKIYDRIEKDFVSEVKGLEVETDHATTKSIWLARITGGCDTEGTFKWNPKLQELLYLLKYELSKEPVVVWCRFDTEIKMIADTLLKKKIPCTTLTGEDTRETKKKKQEWFRTCSVPGRVIICQEMKVAEFGVNMSASSTAVYYSFVYSGNTIAQTEDRIEDPMKKQPLLYIYLVAEGTVDEDVVETIRDKVRSAKQFMAGFNSRFRKRIMEKYATK